MKKFISLILSIISLTMIMSSFSVQVYAKSEIADKDIFEYTIRENDDIEGEDDVVYITGVKEDVEGELILPKKISGAKVGYICNEAFAGCNKLTSIILSPYVSVIGDGAFINCTSLKEITIPDGVICIGDGAFKNCINLEKISSYDGYPVFDDDPYWWSSGVFEGCESLKTIDLPVLLEELNHTVFAGCTNLETVYLPYSVKKIQEGTFYDCENLTEIYFASSFPPEIYNAYINEKAILYHDDSYASEWTGLSEYGYNLQVFDVTYKNAPECYVDKSPVGYIAVAIGVLVAVVGVVIFVRLKNKKSRTN